MSRHFTQFENPEQIQEGTLPLRDESGTAQQGVLSWEYHGAVAEHADAVVQTGQPPLAEVSAQVHVLQHEEDSTADVDAESQRDDVTARAAIKWKRGDIGRDE